MPPNPATKTPRTPPAVMALLVGLSAWSRNVTLPFRKDTGGLIDLGRPLAIIGSILGVILAVLVVSALFPTLASSTARLNENLTNDSVTFGDATTDTIKPIFAIIVGVSVLVGVIGLVLGVMRFRND